MRNAITWSARKSVCSLAKNNFHIYKGNDIIYANTMSQAAAKQTFGECARTMMERSGIMV